MRRSLFPKFALIALFAMALPSVGQITVTSANPSSAAQGTINLPVTISGNGFKKGAKASFFVSGTTNNGGVTVNSTSYASSSSLTANISVASNADISNYDVQVTNSDGRTGVGSEAFTVVQGPVTSYIYDSTTNSSGTTINYTLQSDGMGSAPAGSTFAGAGTYWNNVDGVSGTLPDDWYLQLQNQTYRTVRLTFIAIGNSPNKSSLNGSYNAHIATRCFDTGVNPISIPKVLNTPGSSDSMCSMRIGEWYSGGTRYLFVMSPESGFTGSGWSTVTCISTGIFGCGAWTVVPTAPNLLPNPDQANVGNLYIWKNGSGALTFVGQYMLTFNVGLTQP